MHVTGWMVGKTFETVHGASFALYELNIVAHASWQLNVINQTDGFQIFNIKYS